MKQRTEESPPRPATLAERMFPHHSLHPDILAAADAAARMLLATPVEPVVILFPDRILEWCASWADADEARREELGR